MVYNPWWHQFYLLFFFPPPTSKLDCILNSSFLQYLAITLPTHFPIFLPLLTWHHQERELPFSWSPAKSSWEIWHPPEKDDNCPLFRPSSSSCLLLWKPLRKLTWTQHQRHFKLPKMLWHWHLEIFPTGSTQDSDPGFIMYSNHGPLFSFTERLVSWDGTIYQFSFWALKLRTRSFKGGTVEEQNLPPQNVSWACGLFRAENNQDAIVSSEGGTLELLQPNSPPCRPLLLSTGGNHCFPDAMAQPWGQPPLEEERQATCWVGPKQQSTRDTSSGLFRVCGNLSAFSPHHLTATVVWSFSISLGSDVVLTWGPWVQGSHKLGWEQNLHLHFHRPLSFL